MGFLTDEEIAELRPAQETMFPSPIPTRVVSSDEFAPIPQTAQQREVEARLKTMADEIGGGRTAPAAASCPPPPAWPPPSWR